MNTKQLIAIIALASIVLAGAVIGLVGELASADNSVTANVVAEDGAHVCQRAIDGTCPGNGACDGTGDGTGTGGKNEGSCPNVAKGDAVGTVDHVCPRANSGSGTCQGNHAGSGSGSCQHQ